MINDRTLKGLSLKVIKKNTFDCFIFLKHSLEAIAESWSNKRITSNYSQTASKQ